MKHEPIDKFALVTDKIINLLAAGVKPWARPWHSASGPSIYRNVASGNAYSGINPLLCSIDCATLGDFRPFFIGFAQAKALNWQLQKGSKSTWLRWGGVVKRERVNAETGGVDTDYIGCGKWLSVFHISMFSDAGAPVSIAAHCAQYAPEPVARADHARDTAIDGFVAETGAQVLHGGDRAYYMPTTDCIHMPDLSAFGTRESYYSTLLHELTHWTGHKSRLARDMTSGFGSPGYAFEELVAELGAAFLCNDAGITSEADSHASYIDNWLSRLKHDTKFFFKAAGAARSAHTFLEPAVKA